MLSATTSAFFLPTQSSLNLISGGARSGKSRFAEQTALRVGENRLYIATAQAWDAEMRERIKSHRIERGDRFRTLNAPFALHHALAEQPKCDVIVIDCLTLWISNLLLQEKTDAQIREDVHLGLHAAMIQAPRVLVVSNEVGLGIVPDNALARRFRDLNGRLQQDISGAADEVFLAAFGVILPLKKLVRLAAEDNHA
ncbi:MAG TPA: bifunctional adenosylcobinamide kinase/adenosylcobinamide-phosphate guanylyltransferase [Oligoflexus sp.]|uniref:bifunctional adenosylcobinamide kinase/adenosylcobinamide-phosphate guanylyltransferase n=1 Tax=Oligoflexus sp. TaxID=1971216 RepID=UPI002D5616EF|nr:bifunctional adenosylcobinamide kinase/adenosylcobinamide-phosphate guanylyltransferase [Oligoflexus sp.]HYX39053.1 bifunctional adenosylcobinamide kinase/adenosylcobinamide-phosphate guanylyltransferase [Oligoflexus sp.]